MKRFYTSLLGLLMTISLAAADVQGWPANYGGVMLQGFYWDSFSDSKWTNLKSMAPELGQYFSLVWLPQSGNCGGTSMGYDDLYWFPGGNHYTSSFGTEAELRDLITTFKANNIGTIADVVINHRRNVSNWVDFPAETYGGVTYQMLSTDICANDDDGATLSWANSNGYSLSSNNDTGEGWKGMRDLDHKSANVQKSVKAYLKMLLNDLGYVGFRYDMVKGYSGSYTGIYNTDAAPEFSVGECWDGTTTIRNWIDATKVNGWPTSAAFDFQFRYVVRNAANNNNWINLRNQNDGNYPLVSNDYDNGNYRRWAVTFVENHDTERRSNAEQDPLKKDTLAANAFMLAMPGTPCVFLTHWLDCKQDIKSMIDVRKAAGIHNQSVYQEVAYNNFYYAVKSGNSTSDYRLLAVVGKNANVYTPTDANFVKVLSGYHYAYYLNKSLGTAWIDLASGTYEGDTEATITAVSTNSNARLVYTTDGSTPTATSQQATSGTKISLPKGTTTLKVGLLINGVVSGIVSRTYTVTAFEPYDINVYVNTSNVGWTSVNYWTWGGDGSHTPTNSSWPGDKVTTTKTINGKTWYYKTFRINSSTDNVSFVFSTGTGSPQTVDITNINKESFFEIATTQTDGKYNVNNVTDVYSGIGNITIDETKHHTTNNAIYNLAGQRVGKNYKGIVIKNGKKVVFK